jgi:hypothetical protein
LEEVFGSNLAVRDRVGLDVKEEEGSCGFIEEGGDINDTRGLPISEVAGVSVCGAEREHGRAVGLGHASGLGDDLDGVCGAEVASDIQAPDGVMIPRSERYRQLMQMIDVKKNQYKELCSQLGIGLYKIDVFSLRRISKTTNEYVPVFEPQEIDNKSPKTRVRIPIPTYGNVKPTPTTVVQDLNIYEGDAYEFSIRLDFEVNNLTPLAQIRSLPGAAVVFAEFTVTKPNITEDGDNQRTLVLSLTGAQTRLLPGKSYYDVQLTDADNVTHTYVSGIIFVTKEVSL